MLTEYNGMLERYNTELTKAYQEATVDVVTLNTDNRELREHRKILLTTNAVTLGVLILFGFLK